MTKELASVLSELRVELVETVGRTLHVSLANENAADQPEFQIVVDPLRKEISLRAAPKEVSIVNGRILLSVREPGKLVFARSEQLSRRLAEITLAKDGEEARSAFLECLNAPQELLCENGTRDEMLEAIALIKERSDDAADALDNAVLRCGTPLEKGAIEFIGGACDEAAEIVEAFGPIGIVAEAASERNDETHRIELVVRILPKMIRMRHALPTLSAHQRIRASETIERIRKESKP